MKLLAVMLILSPILLCRAFNYFSSYENLMEGVIDSFFLERLDIRCGLVLYPNQKETRGIFKMIKNINKIGKSVLAISFEEQLKRIRSRFYLYNYSHISCGKMLAIVLGWQENAEMELSEFSRNAEMSEYNWLIFLPHNTTTNDYLKNINTPFNSEIITGKFEEDKVELVESYRVAENYPLRVVPYGIFQSNKRILSSPRNNFYKRRNNMEGYQVRTAVWQQYPVTMIGSQRNGNVLIEGYFGKIFHELAGSLNYSITLIEASENIEGYNDRGKWTGILGMLQRDEIDFALGPITLSEDLLTVGEAVRPLLQTHYQVFFRQPGTTVHWNDIFKPFGKHVWLSVVFWILIATYALNKFFYIECIYNSENFKYLNEFTKTNSFLTFLKALCQQGSHFVPESNSCRVLHFTGYFASAVLFTAYSAVLISHLSTKVPWRPFDDLHSFYEEGSYELIAIRKSADYSYFTKWNYSLAKRIYERQMKHIPENQLPSSAIEGIANICKNKNRAFFTNFATSEFVAVNFMYERGCPILHFRKPLDIAFLTIGRKKNFPYGKVIDELLHTMAEVGIFSREKRANWPMKKSPWREVNFEQVTMKQIVQIHFTWIFGMGLSLIILFLEIKLYNGNHKHSCGAMCSKKVICRMEKFIEKYSAVWKIIQDITFAVLIISVAIFIVYVF